MILPGGQYLRVGLRATAVPSCVKELHGDYLPHRLAWQPLPQSSGWGAGQLQKGSTESRAKKAPLKGRPHRYWQPKEIPPDTPVEEDWATCEPQLLEESLGSLLSPGTVGQARRARKVRMQELLQQRAAAAWDEFFAQPKPAVGKSPLLTDPSIGGGRTLEEPSPGPSDRLPVTTNPSQVAPNPDAQPAPAAGMEHLLTACGLHATGTDLQVSVAKAKMQRKSRMDAANARRRELSTAVRLQQLPLAPSIGGAALNVTLPPESHTPLPLEGLCRPAPRGMPPDGQGLPDGNRVEGLLAPSDTDDDDEDPWEVLKVPLVGSPHAGLIQETADEEMLDQVPRRAWKPWSSKALQAAGLFCPQQPATSFSPDVARDPLTSALLPESRKAFRRFQGL